MNSAIQRAARDAVPGAVREYLSFSLAGEAYALDLARIQSIIMVPTLTEVPRAAPHILGVCSVRGALVAVVDLRRRLALPVAVSTRHSRILLTQASNGETVGLLVDSVRYVVRPKVEQIEWTQGNPGGDLSDFVLGVARLDKHQELKRRPRSAILQPPSGAPKDAEAVRASRAKKEWEVIVILDLDNLCGQRQSEDSP